MRGRSDGSKKKRLTYVGVVAVVLLFLYLYFHSRSDGESALEYGSRSLKKFGSSYLGSEEDADLGKDEVSFKLGLDDGEDGIVPKSFPVSSVYLVLSFTTAGTFICLCKKKLS